MSTHLLRYKFVEQIHAHQWDHDVIPLEHDLLYVEPTQSTSKEYETVIAESSHERKKSFLS